VTAADTGGVTLDTPDELIEAFAAAVPATLREMAGVEVVVRDTVRASGGEGPADVSAALRLDGGVERWLVLSFPLGTAAALARRVLAEVGGEPDAGMVRDCACELANVIAGQAKALVFGTPHHFTLSTPTVLTAGQVGTAGRTVIRFDSEAGEFTLHLGPPPSGAGESPFTGPGD
jgi:CheY-specific phosphatase CheX